MEVGVFEQRRGRRVSRGQLLAHAQARSRSHFKSVRLQRSAGLALVLGGAIGNLVDRVRFGYVVDFLLFGAGGHYWPAFNVADSAICVGVGLLALDMLRQKAPAPSPTNLPPAVP